MRPRSSSALFARACCSDRHPATRSAFRSASLLHLGGVLGVAIDLLGLCRSFGASLKSTRICNKKSLLLFGDFFITISARLYSD